MIVKTIIIPTGKHKHKGIYWRIPKFIPRQTTRKFMFTPSCLYDLKDEDQHDVNKLFGMSFNLFPTCKTFTPHHINSARFGWRALLDNRTIQIVAYEYLNRFRRPTQVIAEVNINEWYEYLMYWVNGKMYYSIRTDDTSVATFSTDYPLRKDTVLGYELDVYFGGNEVAPQTITIFEK